MTDRPAWLDHLARETDRADQAFFSAYRPRGTGHRESAVLVLVGPHPERTDEEILLLIERAGGLRSHAGQIAFPGGRVDPGDDGPVSAALREAAEEIDLDPAGVEIVTTFPRIHVPVSDSAVTAVVGWWHTPSTVRVHSPAEVAAVTPVPVAELRDPANRFIVTHPVGYRGVGFETRGLFVWGFTAGLIDRLLVLSGLERPWDTGSTRPLPERVSGGRAPMLPDVPGETEEDR